MTVYKVFMRLFMLESFRLAIYGQDEELSAASRDAVAYNGRLLKGFTSRASFTPIMQRNLLWLTTIVAANNLRKGGLGVNFKTNRMPDFSGHRTKLEETRVVFIKKMWGSRSKDFTRAKRAMNGEPITKRGYGLRNKPTGTTWHHHEILGVMELVNTSADAHPFNRHAGGVFIYKTLTGRVKYR